LNAQTPSLKLWQHAVEAVAAVCAAFLMLAIMPKLMPSSDLMTHLTARVQAVLVGSFYPAQERDNISVLLIDDKAVAAQEKGWPLPYASHARWLTHLGTQYQPRAIFVDITFTQARKDDSLPQLVAALCRLRDQGVPVFLAALHNEETGQLAVREGLASPAGEPPCFTLVGVTYQTHQVDRFVWNYPLWTAEDATGAARSSALAMAQDVAGLKVARLDEPMALTWGVDNRGVQRLGAWCRHAGPVAAEMLPPRLRALFAGEEVFKPICPYGRSLTMGDLRPQTEADEVRLHELLDGKYIMLGAAISGHNDMVSSPVHGAIPGVFMHAMALDNLLTYQGHYKRALEWELPPAWPLFWMGLLVVLVVHTLRILLWQPYAARAPQRKAWLLARWPWLHRLLDDTQPGRTAATPPSWAHLPHWLLGKTVALLLFLCRKLARILITSAVVMGVVLGLQRFFEVGTLPIVDLVVMALAAEWLGWTAKVMDVFPWRSHTTSGELHAS
jgi:CHASE2 domain-containing sensor protein